MQLHSRHGSLSAASHAFALSCMHELDSGKVQTYEDGNYICSQIDAFWINASRKNLPMESAIAAWEAFDTSNIDFGAVVKAIGDKFVVSIKANALTYGEINSVLTSSRSSDAKYQLRAERKPDEPDYPSGLA